MIREFKINLAIVEKKGENKEATKLKHAIEDFIANYPFPLSYSIRHHLIESMEIENVRPVKDSDQKNPVADH